MNSKVSALVPNYSLKYAIHQSRLFSLAPRWFCLLVVRFGKNYSVSKCPSGAGTKIVFF